MTQPYDPYQHGQQQAPASGWAPPGQAPDPRQWQAQYAAYPPPPPAPKKTRKWPWIVGGLFVLLFVVPALGNSSKSTTTSSTPTTAPAPAAAPAPAQPLKAADEPAEEQPAAASGPKTSFGDGTWVIGEDIVEGTYKSAGAQEGMFELCSVTTHSDENADSNTTLDWKTANANEPIRLKLSGKVKSVKATGCEDFVKVS
jgi:hypothetical protein